MSDTPMITEPQTTPEAPTCRHHWLIEPPGAATSKGRCKRCGAEREFRNSANDLPWQVGEPSTTLSTPDLRNYQREHVDEIVAGEVDVA